MIVHLDDQVLNHVLVVCEEILSFLVLLPALLEFSAQSDDFLSQRLVVLFLFLVSVHAFQLELEYFEELDFEAIRDLAQELGVLLHLLVAQLLHQLLHADAQDFHFLIYFAQKFLVGKGVRFQRTHLRLYRVECVFYVWEGLSENIH